MFDNNIFNVYVFLSNNFLNISIWLIDKILTGTTTPGQSGLGSNGNEGVLHIFCAPGQKPHHHM